MNKLTLTLLTPLLLGVVACPVVAQPTTETLSTATQKYADEHNFNGTILVQHKGKQIYHRSYGIADREFDIPNTNTTKYWIASITKAFTSVLVLQLVEEGRIDLNDNIKRYLPEYHGEGADRVTINHLLNHTSGIQNFDSVKSFDEAVRIGIKAYQLPHTTDELLTNFCSGTLIHEVGKTFEYNNADYIILGKIIEQVANQSYEALLEQRILKPLEMKDSGMLYQQNVVKQLSRTYLKIDDAKPMIHDFPVYMQNWYAAGGMYSTTSDVLKFSEALYHGKLLKPETLKKMLTPGLDNYGYGLWVFDLDVNGKKHKVAQRPGSIMGANCVLLRFLEDDLTIIILSNTNATDIDAFSFLIGRTFFQRL